jgi:hypothetical protein
MVEDGLLHIYLTVGFPGHADTSNNGFPYAAQWGNIGSGDGTTVTFSGISTSEGVTTPLPMRPFAVSIGARFPDAEFERLGFDNGSGGLVGARIVSGTVNYATGFVSVTFTGPPSAGQGIQIRYVENNNTLTRIANVDKDPGGGLNHQFVDYYTHIFDATAAAGHAPDGVTATCASGVVTLSWNDALPHQNYRVARGTTGATQGTPIGDVTGLTITNTPGSSGLFYYRVTTLNAGTPAGFRIVPVYVSPASVLANKHVQRVQADGGDITKINVARLEAAISFLTARDWIRDLLFWASPDWGVKESAGHIVKVYCLGTTRLPRGGDLTFSTSTTTYNATGLNGTCAAFVNASNNSFSYFGGNRFNPIRRKRQITVAAMYARTQTSADITFAGLRTSNGNIEGNYLGTEQPGLSLSHNAGVPGAVEFKLKDDNLGAGARQITVTATATSAAYNIAIGTYDGSAVRAYHNGTGGAADTSYDPNPFFLRDTVLAGSKGENGTVYPVLGVGSRNVAYTAPVNVAAITPGTYSFPANEAQFTASDIFVMARGVSGSDATLLTGLFNGFATGAAAPAGNVAPLRLRLRA